MKAKSQLFKLVPAEGIKDTAPAGKSWWRVEFTQTDDWVKIANEIRLIEGIDAFIKGFLDYILTSKHFSYGGTLSLSKEPTTKEICEILLEEMKSMDKMDTSIVSVSNVFTIRPLDSNNPKYENPFAVNKIYCRVSFKRTWSLISFMEKALEVDWLDPEIRDFMQFVIDNKFESFSMHLRLSHSPTLKEVCAMAHEALLISKGVMENREVHVEHSARTLLPKPNAIQLD